MERVVAHIDGPFLSVVDLRITDNVWHENRVHLTSRKGGVAGQF